MSDNNIVIIVIFVLAGIAFAVYGWYASAKRKQELLAWAATRRFEFSPEKQYGFDSKYPQFYCLQEGDNQYAYNTLEGDWSGRSFLGFDYHYETHTSNSKGGRSTQHHHFSAVIIKSEVPLNPLFIRPEGFFDKIKEFFGYEDIDFESAEFSRKFYVQAPDKKWAYDVIHARMMEFLLASPTFHIKFDWNCVIAYHNSTFSVNEFESAANVIKGILDRLPDYVAKQQQEAFFGNKGTG
ncbi:MAG: hypothetical protein WC975_07825 [Phycisphaerae bacterium]